MGPLSEIERESKGEPTVVLQGALFFERFLRVWIGAGLATVFPFPRAGLAVGLACGSMSGWETDAVGSFDQRGRKLLGLTADQVQAGFVACRHSSADGGIV